MPKGQLSHPDSSQQEGGKEKRLCLHPLNYYFNLHLPLPRQALSQLWATVPGLTFTWNAFQLSLFKTSVYPSSPNSLPQWIVLSSLTVTVHYSILEHVSVVELYELTSWSDLGLNFFSVACAVKYKYGLVQFSHSAVSDSLQPHGLQHTRPPCPSPTPGVYPNSCSLSRWCHPAISYSIVPFSSCLQSFPASGSFQMNQLFASGGQSIGVAASNQSYIYLNLNLKVATIWSVFHLSHYDNGSFL